MEEAISKNFIEQIIEEDLKEGKYEKIVTRFPPEPNGYLHIGHAKSILLNYGLAKEYGGDFHFRFDDTNPTKEKTEYVDSIKEDVEWLGADYDQTIYFASNYFDRMYECAEFLIKKGKAYVRPDAGGDPGIQGNADGTGKKQSVQRPYTGRKPCIIPRNEKWRV